MATPVILPASLLRATTHLRGLVEGTRAMGIGTFARHLGVTVDVALAVVQRLGLRTTIITVEAVRGAPSTDRPYLIVHAGDRPTTTLGVHLGHYAGCAEIQLLINGMHGEWNHARVLSGPDATAIPDVYWKPPRDHPLYRRLGMEISIEYDRGSYPPATRLRKLEHAIGQRRPLIYGCPIPRRLLLVHQEVEAIHRRLRAQGRVLCHERDSPVLLVPTYWHLGSEVP